jgi:hypothetical protein
MSDPITRIRSTFEDAGEDAPRLNAEAVDVPELTLQQWLTFDPAQHSDELKAIQERRRALRKELRDAKANQQELTDARKRLKAVSVRHKVGEATEEELTAARDAVENAETSVDDDEAAREALDILDIRYAYAYVDAVQQFESQGPRLYADVAKEMIAPIRALYDVLSTVEEMQNASRAVTAEAERLAVENPGTRTNVYGSGRPLDTSACPPPIRAGAVRKWLQQYDPEFTA